jgi:AcrR family transcriptional regulator
MTKNSRAPKSRKTSRGRPARAAASPAVSTRERLLDCALTLFASKGYSATGTQEIIDAAGVTKPVLYHYFASKEALFRHLVGGIYEASAAAWDAILAAETSAVARLRGIARVSFAGCARDPRIPRLMMQTHFGPPIAELHEFMEAHTARRFAQVLGIVAAGLDAGELRGGDAAAVALLFCCIMDQHINVLARLPNAAALLTAARADALVDAFLHGCGGGKRTAFELPALALSSPERTRYRAL